MGRVVASNVPRAEVDHAVARAFDAESSVVVSVRDAGCAESVLADEGSIPGELSPSPALRRIWKRMESESKACAKRGVQTTVRVSFLQLVGSSLHDLLSSSSSPPQLSLRDYDPSKSPHISGADEVTVTSEAEMLECFQHGAKRLASCNKEPARPSHEEHSRPLPPGNSPHAANGGTPVCPPHQPCASPSPECHLIFSFHIHLQGPLAAMPSQQNSAKPKAAKSSGQRRKARGPPQQVDEWIFRSILRCVDICVPLTPPNGSTAEQPTDTAPPGTSSNGASAPLTSPSVLHLQGSHTLAREDTRSDTGTPSATAGPSRLQQQDGSPHAELSLVPAIMSPFAAAPQSASPLAPRPEWSKPASPTAPADGHRQAADSQDDLIDTATHSTQHASAHEKLGADGEASGPDSTRKRTREAFVFKAHAHAEGTTAAGQGAAQRPHHEVSTFVGLQTAARRLRTSPSTRSPVIMSLVTGAAARAPSLTLPALDGATAGEERSAAQPVSGVQALEGVLRARQEQKAMLPFRAHLLTRILRPSISGTAHCVTLAEPRRLEAEPAETGEEFKARHRAAVLRAFLAALQAHSPRRDTARLDLQSDVVKWMQLENRSLKGELKTAREKVTMLQGFVASRGANEVKTWELWKELETKRASASELQEEVDALLAALHTARSTAEAAEAAASAAGDRAAIEAGMRADVQREAASEAARAAAMEAAADQMARQLATRSTAEHSTAMAAAAAAKAHQVEEPASAEGGAGLHDARPEVSVGLSVANGAVQMRMSVRNSGRAHAAQCHDVSSLRAVESSVDAIASRMGGPGASNGVDAAQPLAGTAQVGDLPDAVLAVRSTLTASLAAAAQQHELRCEQAWRAASGCNDGAVADSTVLGLLTLLARALAPLAAAPSLASGSQPPLSGAGGVTPSASACSLDASLATQQLPSPRTPPYGAARSQAMSRELSPSRTESTSCTPVSASLTGDHPRTNFSTGAPPFDTLPSHVHIHPAGPQQLRAAEVSASQRAAGLAAYPSSSTLHQQGGGASPSEYQGAHWHEDSGAACELFGAVRTAWPADAASTPAEWVTALLGVLQLPRTIDAHIHSLDAKVCMYLRIGLCIRRNQCTGDSHAMIVSWSLRRIHGATTLMFQDQWHSVVAPTAMNAVQSQSRLTQPCAPVKAEGQMCNAARCC
eukprot:jgi/Ulvmu1/6253/UM028_0111.1